MGKLIKEVLGDKAEKVVVSDRLTNSPCCLVTGEHRCVEQKPDKILDGLVVLVLLSTGTESLNDGVLWVDLHGLLGSHVSRHGAVLEGLRLHDTLHVSRPAVLASHKTAWGVSQTV